MSRSYYKIAGAKEGRKEENLLEVLTFNRIELIPHHLLRHECSHLGALWLSHRYQESQEPEKKKKKRKLELLLQIFPRRGNDMRGTAKPTGDRRSPVFDFPRKFDDITALSGNRGSLLSNFLFLQTVVLSKQISRKADKRFVYDTLVYLFPFCAALVYKFFRLLSASCIYFTHLPFEFIYRLLQKKNVNTYMIVNVNIFLKQFLHISNLVTINYIRVTISNLFSI